MANRVVHDEAAREALMRGVKTVAAAVKSTLGLKGRPVLLVRPFGPPAPTRDGVTVAKEIDLEDPLENAGARLLKQVAASADEQAGDGTTTAVVLAEAILVNGMKLVAAGYDRQALATGLSHAVAWAQEALIGLAFREAEGTPALKRQVYAAATVSLHGDAELAAIVADAIELVGVDGWIELNETSKPKAWLEPRPGFQFEQGWTEMGFVTDQSRMAAELEEPLILVCDRPILTAGPHTNAFSLIPLLEKVAGTRRPFLIVAESLDGQALTLVAANMQRGTIQCCAVKPPGFGDARREQMEDLAIAVGATVLSTRAGDVLRDFPLDKLGSCARALVLPGRTILTGPGGDEAAREERVQSLRILREVAEDPYEQEQLSQRIGRLTSGVAVIRAAAPTEMALRELKERVNDAVYAARATLKEGIVPGGGVALAFASRKIANRSEYRSLRDGERAGADLLVKALLAPLRQIAANAGVKPDVVEQEVMEHLDRCEPGCGWGYNAATDNFEEMVEAGVIDPTRVVRTALEKAAGSAGLLLMTEAAVVPVQEKQGGTGHGQAR